jgi:hypothetical protein
MPDLHGAQVQHMALPCAAEWYDGAACGRHLKQVAIANLGFLPLPRAMFAHKRTA